MIALGGLKAWAAKWLALAGGLVLALFAVAIAAFRKGRKAQADADAGENAKAEVESAQAVQHAAEARAEVERETSKLPDAPAQTVGTAAADTAAGKLDDRWVRDLSEDDPS